VTSKALPGPVASQGHVARGVGCAAARPASLAVPVTVAEQHAMRGPGAFSQRPRRPGGSAGTGSEHSIFSPGPAGTGSEHSFSGALEV
jgi:hypothetical protein